MNQTPIYVGCRNGNLKIVQLLLDQQADPHILSEVDDEEYETALQVAVRWDHKIVVEYLLQNVKWSQEEIKKTIKMKNINHDLFIMLKEYSKKRYNCLFNFCLCI